MTFSMSDEVQNKFEKRRAKLPQTNFKSSYLVILCYTSCHAKRNTYFILLDLPLKFNYIYFNNKKNIIY